MCDCNLCKRHQEFMRVLEAVDESLRPYFEAMYDHLNNVEMDRDHNRLIIDRKWPGAEEILAQFAHPA